MNTFIKKLYLIKDKIEHLIKKLFEEIEKIEVISFRKYEVSTEIEEGIDQSPEITFQIRFTVGISGKGYDQIRKEEKE